MTELVQKKICLLGDFAVGKTSLVRRFVEGRFEEKYLSTIGVKVSRKTLTRPYGEMSLLVWDLAGSNGFNTSAEDAYLRGAVGAVIVCDLTRPDTLLAFERYTRLMQGINPKVSLVYAANKFDLQEERLLSDEDIRNACRAMSGGVFIHSSAKTGEGVEFIFKSMADLIEAQQ